MKHSQRKAHLWIWRAWLLLIPLALFFALRTPLKGSGLWSRLWSKATEAPDTISFEIHGPEKKLLLDLYIPETFAYPAVVAKAVDSEGKAIADLGQIGGAGMYRFDLPIGTAEVWLFDTVQGRAVYQIPL